MPIVASQFLDSPILTELKTIQHKSTIVRMKCNQTFRPILLSLRVACLKKNKIEYYFALSFDWLVVFFFQNTWSGCIYPKFYLKRLCRPWQICNPDDLVKMQWCSYQTYSPFALQYPLLLRFRLEASYGTTPLGHKSDSSLSVSGPFLGFANDSCTGWVISASPMVCCNQIWKCP